MRYRVYDVESKKERTLSNCVTDLGAVGNVKRVSIRENGKLVTHHFRVIEILPEN